MAQKHGEPTTIQPRRREWCLSFGVYEDGQLVDNFLLSAHATGPLKAKEYLKKKFCTKTELKEDHGDASRPGIPFIPGVSEISLSDARYPLQLVQMLAPEHSYTFTNTRAECFDSLEALVDGSRMFTTSNVKLIQG